MIMRGYLGGFLLTCWLAVGVWGAEAPPALEEAPADAWPSFRGGPAMHGRSATRLAPKLKLAWRANLGLPLVATAAIADGGVYIGGPDGKLHALKLKDGGKLWELNLGGAFEAAPLILDDLLIIGNTNGKLHALERATGKLRWEAETEGKIIGGANFVRQEGDKPTLILVGSYDNQLHCFQASDGKAVWTYATENYLNGAPARHGTQVVVGGCDGQLHVLNWADGEVEQKLAAGAYVAGTPALFDGVAYFGHYGGKVLAMDIKKGPEWLTSITRDGMQAFIAAANDQAIRSQRWR